MFNMFEGIFKTVKMLVQIANPVVPERPRSIKLSLYAMFAKINFCTKVF